MIPGVARLDTSGNWNTQDLSKFDVVVVAMRQVGLDFAVLDSLEDTKVHFCCK